MKFFWFFLLCISFSYAQITTQLTGTVIDKATQKPIETAAVYFNNTTIGTTTNSKGEFSINYTDAVTSNLVISYLGYQKVMISDYREHYNLNIQLIVEETSLDEVFLSYDDALTRKQKLHLFRKEFLGTSKYAKSCKILNENDLILRYNAKEKVLYADSKNPIIINNKSLNYQISYDLLEFEIVFWDVNPDTNYFNVNAVSYVGASFFKSLQTNTSNKIRMHRNKAYKGSVQHFIRSLFNFNLYENDYWVFHKRKQVNASDYISVMPVENSELKKVSLSVKKLTFLFNKKQQSDLILNSEHFFIDRYGNFAPANAIYFSGALGSQRIGDALPLDFNVSETKQKVEL